MKLENSGHNCVFKEKQKAQEGKNGLMKVHGLTCYHKSWRHSCKSVKLFGDVGKFLKRTDSLSDLPMAYPLWQWKTTGGFCV